jgi:hypothetical protein
MQTQPLYTPENVRRTAYRLRYSWAGWPSTAVFPDEPPPSLFGDLDGRWETDGFRRLEMK